MGGTRTDSGKRLQREWKIPAKQTRYRKTGDFYMPLKKFPGALADANGYVLFRNEQELENCREVEVRGRGSRNERLGIKGGISKLSAYVRYTNLKQLRKAAVNAFQRQLIEEEKALKLLKAGDMLAWKTQQHVAMKAEHDATNAKQAYEVEMYNVIYGQEKITDAREVDPEER